MLRLKRALYEINRGVLEKNIFRALSNDKKGLPLQQIRQKVYSKNF
jgi:hypothetical protein